MEGQPRSGGGGAPWGLPPAAPAEATSRPPWPGRRPTTTTHHEQRQAGVKVKHIVTREVSTDQANFKDVVQRLTGKDSAAARAAVVAAGADGTSCWSSGGGAAVVGREATTSTTAVTSGGVVYEGNVVAGAGATTMFLSEENMRRWGRGDT